MTAAQHLHTLAACNGCALCAGSLSLPGVEFEPCVHCGQSAYKVVPETVCEDCRVYFAGGFNVVIPEAK